MENSNTPDDLVVEEINKRNPYYINREEQSITNNNIVTLSEEQYMKAIKIEYFASSVRIICIIDGSINIIFLYYGYTISYIFFLFSFFGYVGTVYYNKFALLLYLIYHYAITLFRTSILVLYIAMAVSKKYRDDIRDNYPYIIMPSNYTQEIIMMSMIFLCQLFINYMIQVFYLLLPYRNIIEYTTYQITNL